MRRFHRRAPPSARTYRNRPRGTWPGRCAFAGVFANRPHNQAQLRLFLAPHGPVMGACASGRQVFALHLRGALEDMPQAGQDRHSPRRGSPDRGPPNRRRRPGGQSPSPIPAARSQLGSLRLSGVPKEPSGELAADGGDRSVCDVWIGAGQDDFTHVHQFLPGPSRKYLPLRESISSKALDSQSQPE